MTGGPFGGADINVPPGTVVPWHAPASAIPTGWLLCDGNNGTPDLRDRYVKSVPDGTTDPGSVVGTNSYSLAVGQLPSHDHPIGGTDTVGDHAHQAGCEVKDFSAFDSSTSTGVGEGDQGTAINTSSNGGHSHSITAATAGSDNSIDNRPYSHTVHFIQRA